MLELLVTGSVELPKALRMLFRTLFTFAALASTACARLAGGPERTELVATVPCLTDRTCHHGKCRLVIDDDVWTFGNATLPRATLSIATPNRTLHAVPKLVCLCDDGWATVDASEPCAYPRKSRLYIVLMQFFFGFLGVGAFLLGWTAWGVAVLALSVDLVWGFCGILSLGHGAFFALGGYCMGMYLMRQIGSRGVYGNPILPDFMVFLNYKELPWFWHGFDHFWFAAVMIVLVPSVLAFALGWFAFRSRVTGVYLSIITQALTYALLLAFFRNDMGFGGNNGLTDFKDILGFDIQSDATRAGLFAASALALAGGLVIAVAITASKLGKVLIAVRDAESRTRFLGYRVEHYKLFVWTVSAMMAGLAGALYVPQVGIINPSEMSAANSIEIAIWAAGGERAPLIGPIIGAFIVNGAKSLRRLFNTLLLTLRMRCRA